MQLIYRLLIETPVAEFDLDSFRKLLPGSIEARRQDDAHFLRIQAEDHTEAQALIDRELDRYYFLSYIKCRAEPYEPGYGPWSDEVWSTTLKPLPEALGPQTRGDDPLWIQLRLWGAALEQRNLVLKTILLFQILELKHPNRKDAAYPEYDHTDKAPSPLRECTLLCDWVAHAGTDIRPRLKRYCDYLGVDEKFYEPTDPAAGAVLAKRIHILESDAPKIIDETISFSGPV